MDNLFEFKKSEIIKISAKTGLNVGGILDEVPYAFYWRSLSSIPSIRCILSITIEVVLFKLGQGVAEWLSSLILLRKRNNSSKKFIALTDI